MKTAKFLCSALILASSFVALSEAASTQAFQIAAMYVHADNGLDTNPGSAAAPFKTLNHALEVAYVLLHPGPGVPMVLTEIKVYRASTPIAPSGWGGQEVSGWQTPAEKTQGITHKPFPLRLVPFVSVIGIPRVGQLPVIEIDEQNHGSYATSNWEPGLSKTLVWGAAGCTLRAFTLDGTHYTLNRANHEISGVVAHNVLGFNVEDCVIRELHDGVFYDADAGESATGVVRDCILSGFFPVAPTIAEPQKAGHAALWLTGNGLKDVDVIDSEISGSHDAIEIKGPSASGSIATLDITGTCSFHNNENGLEVVGIGTATVTILGASFVRNANILPNGTSFQGGSTGAVIVRGMNEMHATIRDTTFANNAYGVSWAINPSSPSEMDLGKDGDSGGNAFLPFDYSAYSAGADPYRVHVFHKSPGGSMARLFAAGNTWIPGMQGAAPTTGCIPIGDSAGPINLPNAGVNDGPPGPQAGPLDGMGIPWLRNFSILQSSGKIEFGSSCP